jgi:hypothetical protein
MSVRVQVEEISFTSKLSAACHRHSEREHANIPDAFGRILL